MTLFLSREIQITALTIRAIFNKVLQYFYFLDCLVCDQYRNYPHKHTRTRIVHHSLPYFDYSTAGYCGRGTAWTRRNYVGLINRKHLAGYLYHYLPIACSCVAVVLFFRVRFHGDYLWSIVPLNYCHSSSGKMWYGGVLRANAHFCAYMGIVS